MLPSWLLKPFVAPLAIGIAALSIGGNVWLGFLHWSDGRTITTLSDSNTKLAGDLSTCRMNSARLEGAVSANNAAVDGIKSAAEAAAAGAKAGQAAAEVAAVKLDRVGVDLGKLPPLPVGADRCAAASALITDTLAGEHSK